MKVYFVGMHNKQGMKPLDSKTLTGKMIDEIILQLKEKSIECVKTNLYEEEHFPEFEHEIQEANILWEEKYKPTEKDLAVTLGSWVRDNFNIPMKKIFLRHPAGDSMAGKKKQYTFYAMGKISECIGY